MKSLIRILFAASIVFIASFEISPRHANAIEPAGPNNKYKGAEIITAAQLKDYLSFIASDELEGRDTPSRGLDIAAKFIATNLSRWGVKPGGDNGTYFQRIALNKTTVDSTQSTLEINGQRFKHGAEFLGNAYYGAGTVSGPLVYVGHGLVIKAKNINAFEGIDLKDKIVVWTNELPTGVTYADFSGPQGEKWEGAAHYAARHGALGGISIASFQNLTNWAQTRKNAIINGALTVDKLQTAPENKIPVISLRPVAANILFQGEQENAAKVFNSAAGGQPLPAFEFKPEKKVTFTVMMKTDQVLTQNVVGVLEGSDGNLKNEYVALGAHYDHVGTGAPINGDGIYNGADDDGSGTVSVLAIAEALAKGQRPKRSVLFIWHTGEEKGLWGARYFTRYSTVPIEKIVVQLNLDMVGRSKKPDDTKPVNAELSGTNEIYVIGSKMMSTTLGELSEAVNNSYYNLAFNYKYDDPNDPNKFFFRSDHFCYAQKGIPIIFYTDGDHEDYHKVTDHVEKIDFQKMLKVARTVYATAWELAGGMKRPVVDKKLPPELTKGLF